MRGTMDDDDGVEAGVSCNIQHATHSPTWHAAGQGAETEHAARDDGAGRPRTRAGGRAGRQAGGRALPFVEGRRRTTSNALYAGCLLSALPFSVLPPRDGWALQEKNEGLLELEESFDAVSDVINDLAVMVHEQVPECAVDIKDGGRIMQVPPRRRPFNKQAPRKRAIETQGRETQVGGETSAVGHRPYDRIRPWARRSHLLLPMMKR